MRISTPPQERDAKDASFLKSLDKVILANAHNPHFSVPLLAEALHMRIEEFRMRVRSVTGMLPKDYFRMSRLILAKSLVVDTEQPLKNIAYMTGFLSYPSFWRSFKNWHGKSPSDIRNAVETNGQLPLLRWSMPPTEELRDKLAWAINTRSGIKDVFSIMIRLSREEKTTLNQIAYQLNLSNSQLTRNLRKTLSTTPMKLLHDLRVLHGASLLSDPDLSVAEVALTSGFFDQPHFSRAFKKKYGVTPNAFRKKKMSDNFYPWLKGYLKD